MEQRLRDPRWRRKNTACAWLCLFPVFGFFGFLFMGKKSGRRDLTGKGMIYGCINIVTLLLYWFSDYGLNSISGLRGDVIYTIYVLCLLTLPLVSLICTIHTFVSVRNYLRYLALYADDKPQSSPLLSTRGWKGRNQLWLLWLLAPNFGALSILFVGKKTRNRRITNLGIFLFALTQLVCLTYINANASWTVDLTSYYLELYTFQILIFLNLLTPFVAFYFREEYLIDRARRWEQDCKTYPMLASHKWRSNNCLWQIFTFIFPLGGIGIARAGVISGKPRRTLMGLVFSLLYIFFIFANIYSHDFLRLVSLTARRIPDVVSATLTTMLTFTIAMTTFYGIMIRWDTLKARAGALQGYATEFERDLDMHNRMRARNLSVAPSAPAVPAQNAPAQPQPVSQQFYAPAPGQSRYEMPAQNQQPVRFNTTVRLDPEPVPQPAAAPPAPPVQTHAAPQSSGPIDVNRCTQMELMQLPGITVAQAKRAIEHRTNSGEFKSLDEFVELLQIKPHFAVQIFEKATAGQRPAPAPRNAPENGAARRRIDF